jgi:peptide/nickel transport system substrate-binding protein
VRQALSYAAPRTALIRGVLLDQGEPITSPFKPGTWAYNNSLAPYPYDLVKAKSLLAEAGWADTNADGILDKNGHPFAFTVVTNQGNDQRIKTAEILQYAFKQLGIDMKIQVQEWATLIENTINARAFEAIILGWSMSVEPDPFDVWHSSKTGPREFNFISFNNPEADRLMTHARQTFNQTERKKHLDQFQTILHDEQPYLFLFAPYSLVAVHKRVKGIVPMPAGISYNSTDWYVPTTQQLYPNPSLMP